MAKWVLYIKVSLFQTVLIEGFHFTHLYVNVPCVCGSTRWWHKIWHTMLDECCFSVWALFMCLGYCRTSRASSSMTWGLFTFCTSWKCIGYHSQTTGCPICTPSHRHMHNWLCFPRSDAFPGKWTYSQEVEHYIMVATNLYMSMLLAHHFLNIWMVPLNHLYNTTEALPSADVFIVPRAILCLDLGQWLKAILSREMSQISHYNIIVDLKFIRNPLINNKDKLLDYFIASYPAFPRVRFLSLTVWKIDGGSLDVNVTMMRAVTSRKRHTLFIRERHS